MTERQLRRLEESCYAAERRLNEALARLGNAVSEVLGHEVTADFCGGSEIEFRPLGEDGIVADDFDCIRIEEVIDHLNNF